MLFEGVQLNDLDVLFENVSFVTFNYDRCIEHYLEQAVRQYFRLPPDEARKLMSRLEVVHTYGQVGKLPWQTGNFPSNDFGEDLDRVDLNATAGQIRTFTEGIADKDILANIRGLIQNAEVVVYLGFSFGDINMDLLALESSATPRSIVGTTVGMSDPNRESISRMVANSMGPDPSAVQALHLPNLTCTNVLHDYSRFILYG